MTSDQPGSAPPPPPNVAALVDAIDTRARQAGSEGASAVMQRMLGSVTEVLSGIQDRLDQLEDAVSAAAGAGGGGAALVEAVQSGLATFNARLGRLEEAFVQAVDESGSGTQAVVDEVRTVVTRALEESPAASGVDTSIDPETRDALTRIEAALSGLVAARDERSAQEVITMALVALGERLDGLERRLVVAVQQHASVEAKADLSTLDLGPQLAPLVERLDAAEARSEAAETSRREAVDATLAPLLDRLDDLDRRMGDTPRAVTTSVESVLGVVQARIADLEQLLRDRATEPIDPTTAVRAALAPVLERMDGLDASNRATAARASEGVGRVDASLAALPGRFTSLEERLSAVVSSLAEEPPSPVDPSVLARLEDAVDRLGRDEASARLLQLVEERMSVGLRAVTERTDEVRRAVDQLVETSTTAEDDGALDDVVASLRALQSATRDVPDEVATAVGSRLVPMADRLAGLDGRLDALHELVTRASAATPVDPSDALASLAAQVDAVSSRLGELADRPVPAIPPVPDPSEALAQITTRLEGLASQIADLARRPVPTAPDPSEALRRITSDLEALSGRVAELAARPVPTAPDPSRELAHLASALDALSARVGEERPSEPPVDIGAIVEQINGAVRREAELLTQRVAALAVGVEASRVLLEQQAQETENSIGRKAGEVTRRLAADFGIKTRRNGPGGRRDPRELGSG